VAEELSSTLQNYLEAVFRAECRSRVARVRDIAEDLDVHKSTVTAALGTLTEKGLIEHEPYGLITLTAEGRDAARLIAARDRIVRDFLTRVLGMKEESAGAAACGLEQAASGEVLDRLVCFLAFLEGEGADADVWLAKFAGFAQAAKEGRRCEEWLSAYVEKIKRMELQDVRPEAGLPSQ
jgi:DtxR family Mn-dependent transcriptional regulator